MNDSNHYVDNKQLLAEITIYRDKVQAAKKGNTNKPPIPEYIGKCMLMIANRLSMKPNFINYSYREEMISDGIENCISYIDNFDPAKSNNPFAYFTQIIYFAFLRRIQKEKKQLYIKHKTMENSLIMNTLVEQGEMDDQDFVPAHMDTDNDSISEFIRAFEETLDKKKVKRKRGLENFMEEEIDADDTVEK
jgi:hypothetical protein